MKKIFLLVALSSSMILPLIRYDKKNDIYYSSDPVEGVDIKEYDELVKRLAPFFLIDPEYIMSHLTKNVKTIASSNLQNDILTHLLIIQRKMNKIMEIYANSYQKESK